MKRVRIGKEFEAEVVHAKADFFDRKVRGLLAVCFLVFGGIAAALTFLVGLVDGTYNEIQCFWYAYGPLLGALLFYYFRKFNAKS